MIINDIQRLLAYAEVGEDIFEDVVGGDAAGDFGKGGDGAADILGKKFLRDAAIKRRNCGCHIVMCAS